MKRQTFFLPAGTVCTRDGIPFALANDTLIECHPENFEAILTGFVPEVSYNDQALACSQAVHSLESPRLAKTELERNQGVQASFKAMQVGVAIAMAEFEAKSLAAAPLTKPDAPSCGCVCVCRRQVGRQAAPAPEPPPVPPHQSPPDDKEDGEADNGVTA